MSKKVSKDKLCFCHEFIHQLNQRLEKRNESISTCAFSKLSFEGLACNCNYSVLHADSGDCAAVFSLQVCTGLRATATQIFSIVLLPVTEKTGPLSLSAPHHITFWRTFAKLNSDSVWGSATLHTGVCWKQWEPSFHGRQRWCRSRLKEFVFRHLSHLNSPQLAECCFSIMQH